MYSLGDTRYCIFVFLEAVSHSPIGSCDTVSKKKSDTIPCITSSGHPALVAPHFACIEEYFLYTTKSAQNVFILPGPR